MKSKMYRFLIVCLALSFWLLAKGQSHGPVYDYSFKKNKFELLGTWAFYQSVYLYDKLRPYEILDDLDDISIGNIPGFDRNTIGRKSSIAGLWSDRTLHFSILAPIALNFFDKGRKGDRLDIALIGLQGYFFENGLNQLVKISAERPRPFVYDRGTEVLNKNISKGDTKSFYSGHASSSAYFSFFAAKVFSDRHPDSPWKPVIWGIAAALPAATAYLRVRAGVHFPSDVIVGYLAGATFGILVPELYKNKNMSLFIKGNGLGFSVVF